ncbi:MAG: hypothetical protein EBU62_05875, partial [Proteobacteria bacterium]|nr:hypothetical protein [Pseudomonadota bacterium]
RELIMKHRTKVDEIAKRLIHDETLDSEAFNAMFDGVPTEIIDTDPVSQNGHYTPEPTAMLGDSDTGGASSRPAVA